MMKKSIEQCIVEFCNDLTISPRVIALFKILYQNTSLKKQKYTVIKEQDLLDLEPIQTVSALSWTIKKAKDLNLIYVQKLSETEFLFHLKPGFFGFEKFFD